MFNFISSLHIIIVVYNKKLDNCDSFQSLIKSKKVDRDLNVFIYDNSLKKQEIKKYNNLKIEYLHDPINSGVSKAYNQGALSALHNNKKWILLLDQDTILPDDLLMKYQEACSKNPGIKLFCPILKLSNGKIFSPCRYLFKRGFHLSHIHSGLYPLNKMTPVNSGMLINLKAFMMVGGYNDKVKLDFADFQFLERFRKMYNEFFVVDAICIQDFSNNEISFKNQLIRFRFYCEGARNVEKDTIFDWFSYILFVLLRAINLSLKYKKFAFLNVYINSFLKNNKL